MQHAYVAVEGGPVIEARGRVPGTAQGELVFTTAYTGYEESLTDPSYRGQVLTFAYPLIGNYGVREDRFESDAVQPAAVIARELTDEVVEWLSSAGVPAVDQLDTRDLVVDIRESGAKRCGIAIGPDVTPDDARAQLETCPTMSERHDIGDLVSVSEPARFGPSDGEPTVALIDCGVKRSIINSLVERGASVHVLPHDTDGATVKALDADLLFISNGPGDPQTYTEAAELVASFAGDLPIAGICLGQQIVALGLGGSTEKMRFGHRGVNQPVQDLHTGQVIMTSQNHGYTVDEHPELSVTQINVNDDTIEGLESDELDIITRQYHPEAHPGPLDSLGFFDDVISKAVEQRRPLAAAD